MLVELAVLQLSKRMMSKTSPSTFSLIVLQAGLMIQINYKYLILRGTSFGLVCQENIDCKIHIEIIVGHSIMFFLLLKGIGLVSSVTF